MCCQRTATHIEFYARLRQKIIDELSRWERMDIHVYRTGWKVEKIFLFGAFVARETTYNKTNSNSYCDSMARRVKSYESKTNTKFIYQKKKEEKIIRDKSVEKLEFNSSKVSERIAKEKRWKNTRRYAKTVVVENKEGVTRITRWKKMT